MRMPFNRFSADRKGSAAIVFALSTLLVFGSIGLSIDGARVYAAQQRLQYALDAATLAAARRAATDGSTDAIESTFNNYFAVAADRPDIAIRSAAPDLSRPRRISASAVADVPTIVMPLLGFSKVEIAVQSAAEFGFIKLEIALALDTTGSMGGAKLASLKASATRLVDTLLDKASEPDAIRFALVPFAQYVNVGLDNRSASWLDVPDDYTESGETCGDHRPVLSSSNCQTVSYTSSNDGTPTSGSYQRCDNVYGDPVYQCSPYTRPHTWNGCVGSRAYPLNVSDASFGTRVPGIMNVSCPSRIQPLTSERAAIHAAIQAMTASGNTYIPAGVTWGWRALSTGEPYSESQGDRRTAGGDRISKTLVLMTDGANTASPTYPAHNGNDATLANQLTSEACTAAKSADIRIYTIAFDVIDLTVKDLLRGCASNAGGFFDAANSSQLDAALQEIGQQLGAMRLTN